MKPPSDHLGGAPNCLPRGDARIGVNPRHLHPLHSSSSSYTLAYFECMLAPEIAQVPHGPLSPAAAAVEEGPADGQMVVRVDADPRKKSGQREMLLAHLHRPLESLRGREQELERWVGTGEGGEVSFWGGRRC